jgi:predicted enzyme related to lactoylglutathione lyase
MKISQPTPELPVPNVRAAQEHYRDRFGFEIAWYHDEGRIGAVAHGDCVIFFREMPETVAPSVFWVFTDCVDETHAELTGLGADVLQQPWSSPSGLRQFKVRDAFGNLFYFFHDL